MGLSREASDVVTCGFTSESDRCWGGRRQSSDAKARPVVHERASRRVQNEYKSRLEPSARKTMMQLVFHKHHPPVQRWKDNARKTTNKMRRRAVEGGPRSPKHACLCGLSAFLQACVFIEFSGEKEQQTFLSLHFFCFSCIVRGDCTGQDVVDCGACFTRTPRRGVSA